MSQCTFRMSSPNRRLKKLYFSVVKLQENNSKYFSRVTGPMEFYFAEFEVELISDNTSDLEIYFNVKKQKTKSMKIVSLTVSCEEYDKQFICGDEWSENLFKRVKANSIIHCECGGTIHLFNIEIKVSLKLTDAVDTVATLVRLASNKLYDNTECTDFQLQTTDSVGTVAVHKYVLSTHSEMFKVMLRGVWKETIEGCVKIDGVTEQTLRHLKDYMYLGILPNTDMDLKSLLMIAARYLMEELKIHCIKKLIESIRMDHVEDFVQLAFQSNIPELMTALVYDVSQHVRNRAILMKMLTETSAARIRDKK